MGVRGEDLPNACDTYTDYINVIFTRLSHQTRKKNREVLATKRPMEACELTKIVTKEESVKTFRESVEDAQFSATSERRQRTCLETQGDNYSGKLILMSYVLICERSPIH